MSSLVKIPQQDLNLASIESETQLRGLPLPPPMPSIVSAATRLGNKYYRFENQAAIHLEIVTRADFAGSRSKV
jgi:hypothetical protein